MLEVAELPGDFTRVRDVINFLQECDPDAVCLGEYDGSLYEIGIPKPILLREVYLPTKYTGASFFTVKEDGPESFGHKVVGPKEGTAVKFG